MIGRNGERGSGISALAARHDDDDDKRNVFVSYLLLSFLVYNSFWDFLGQGVTPTSQRGVKMK